MVAQEKTNTGKAKQSVSAQVYSMGKHKMWSNIPKMFYSAAATAIKICIRCGCQQINKYAQIIIEKIEK